MNTHKTRTFKALTALCLLAFLILGTAAAEAQRGDRVPRRDRTWKGAAIGGAIGAAGAVLKGKREADEILAGAAIGGVSAAASGPTGTGSRNVDILLKANSGPLRRQ